MRIIITQKIIAIALSLLTIDFLIFFRKKTSSQHSNRNIQLEMYVYQLRHQYLQLK